MSSIVLSRFTPGVLPGDVLEATFVQRQALANRTIQLLEDSSKSGSTVHLLFVGPRGIGKSHLLALLHHRVKEKISADRFACSWLREEEWGVGSLLDLLLCIRRSLDEGKGESRFAAPEGLRNWSAAEAEQFALRSLRSMVGSRQLLLFVENLAEVFAGLGEDGQARLRSYLQENAFISIIATATSRFPAVSRRSSPFYGFFRIVDLAELDFAEAVEFLQKLASVQGNDEVREFLGTAAGRARVRAVHHLAGGNHRIFVILSQFLLTRRRLDELADALLRTLDDLTPYYQSRIQSLSRQQRKLVDLLVRERSALTVGRIARECFVSAQTISAQLGILARHGLVRRTRVGRQSFYELKEPLLRLCLEVRSQEREPLRAVVEFLRAWYSRAELAKGMEALEEQKAVGGGRLADLVRDHLAGSEDPKVVACLADCAQSVAAGDFEGAFRSADELVAVRGDAADYGELAHSLLHLGRFDEALEAADKAWDRGPVTATLQDLRSSILEALDRDSEATLAAERAVSLAPTAWRLERLGELLSRSEKYEKALRVFDRALGLSVELTPKDQAILHARRGYVLQRLGRYADALAAYGASLRLDSKCVQALHDRGLALEASGDLPGAVKAFNRSLSLNKGCEPCLHGRARCFRLLGQYAAALGDAEKAMMSPDHCDYLPGDLAELLALAGRWRDVPSAVAAGIQAGKLSDEQTAIWLTAILPNVIVSAQPEGWGEIVAKLIVELQRLERLQSLGQALLEVTVSIVRSADRQLIERWCDTIKGTAMTVRQLQVAARLINVVSRFGLSADPKELLGLPAEEREIAQRLLSAAGHTVSAGASSDRTRNRSQTRVTKGVRRIGIRPGLAV